MANDDNAFDPEEKRSASDPFQELERMFGDVGASETSPAPEAEVADALGREAAPPEADVPEAGVPEAGLLEADVPEADVPMADVPEAEIAPEIGDAPRVADIAAEASEGPAVPDLGALVAALDAATSASALPAVSGAASEPLMDMHAGQRHIVFNVGGTRYALAMGQVIEVGPVPAVTPLPKVPAWLLGVSNLRGEILAVLDFRLFLGLPRPGALDRDRMLVTEEFSHSSTR